MKKGLLAIAVAVSISGWAGHFAMASRLNGIHAGMTKAYRTNKRPFLSNKKVPNSRWIVNHDSVRSRIGEFFGPLVSPRRYVSGRFGVSGSGHVE